MKRSYRSIVTNFISKAVTKRSAGHRVTPDFEFVPGCGSLPKRIGRGLRKGAHNSF